MKSLRSLLLGALILGVLCCSLLATAPTHPGNTVFLGPTILDEDSSAEDSGWIPLGVATLDEDISAEDSGWIPLGTVTLYD